jgi:hypothetical protein
MRRKLETLGTARIPHTCFMHIVLHMFGVLDLALFQCWSLLAHDTDSQPISGIFRPGLCDLAPRSPATAISGRSSGAFAAADAEADFADAVVAPALSNSKAASSPLPPSTLPPSPSPPLPFAAFLSPYRPPPAAPVNLFYDDGELSRASFSCCCLCRCFCFCYCLS